MYNLTLEDKKFAEYVMNLIKNNPHEIYEHYCSHSEINKKTFNNFLQEFKDYHANLQQGIKDINQSTRKVGDILEDLITSVFKIAIFEVSNGNATSSNEIDHIVKKNVKIVCNFNSEALAVVPSHFICECKNYKERVEVTWINKFHSLMESTNTYLGIIFSYHGFTGSNQCGGWLDASGFARKVLVKSLGKEEESKERYIIDFNINDLDNLANGKGLLEIIQDKKLKLRLDVTKDMVYSGTQHENINILNSMI